MTMIRGLSVGMILSVVMLSSSVAVGQEYEIWVKSGKIASRKADGRGWDAFGGAPDPYIKGGVRSGRNEFVGTTTRTDQDTYRPDWNKRLCTCRRGDDIILQVWDEDIAANDFIGQYKFAITPALIAKGEKRVSFDQVNELYIVIKRK